MKCGKSTHGLRATITTLLVEAGHSDSDIGMRTGHRDPRSLKTIKICRGWKGRGSRLTYAKVMQIVQSAI